MPAVHIANCHVLGRQNSGFLVIGLAQDSGMRRGACAALFLFEESPCAAAPVAAEPGGPTRVFFKIYCIGAEQ